MPLPRLLPPDSVEAEDPARQPLSLPPMLTKGELLNDPAQENPELFTKPPAVPQGPVDSSLEGLLSRNRLTWDSQQGKLIELAPTVSDQGPKSEPSTDTRFDLAEDPNLPAEGDAAQVSILKARADVVNANRNYLTHPLSVGLPEEREYEGFKGTAAERASDMARKTEPVVQYFKTDESLVPQQYVHKSFHPIDAVRDTVNFVFSTDMAVAGVKWDEDGAHWGWETAKQQWTEHPYLTALSLSQIAFPVGAAWMKGARVAARAAELAKMGVIPEAERAAGLVESVSGASKAAEVLTSVPKAEPAGVKLTMKPQPFEPAGLLGPGETPTIRRGPGSEVGFPAETGVSEDTLIPNESPLRTTLRVLPKEEPLITPPPTGPNPLLLPAQAGARGVSAAPTATEAVPFSAVGKGYFGTKLGFRFDDHANLVKNLAYGKYNEGRALFSESEVAALKRADTPEAVEKIVSREDLRLRLLGDHDEAMYLNLRGKAMRGQLSGREGVTWWFMDKFRNSYYDSLTKMSDPGAMNIHRFFQKERFNKWLEKVPTNLSDNQQKNVYRHWLGLHSAEQLEKDIGPEAFAYVQGYRNKAKELFTAQRDEGFIDEETFNLFMDKKQVGSEFHLPALKKGTPGAVTLKLTAEYAAGLRGRGESLRIASEKGFDLPEFLTPPTMKQRVKYTTADAVERDLDSLITDPESLLRGGLIRDSLMTQVHREFRDTLMGAMKGDPALAQHTISANDLAALPAKTRAKFWYGFNELNDVVPGLGDRINRMVKVGFAKEGKTVTDSMIPGGIARSTVEKFFGHSPNSALNSVGMFNKFMELMTTVHKTSRTALNPSTHMNNIVGNFMFLSMAGYNPFSNQAAADGKLITRLFIRAAKSHRAAIKAAEGAGRRIESIVFDKESVTKHLTEMGSPLDVSDRLGANIHLPDFFSSQAMRSLIEEQGFDSVEGLQHAHDVIREIERMESKTGGAHGSGAVKGAARVIAGFSEIPGISSTLKNASAAYIGEDMVPKMMYALHLRRKGWGDDSILREVGRRLPQYQTVGRLNKAGRKVVFPWMTFPAETARIVKNNLMDHPVGMSVWMRAPHMARGLAADVGLGPTFDEYDRAMATVPPWGDKYTTLLLNQKNASRVMGGVSGAIGGAMMGALAGGNAMSTAGGALVGGAAGAMAPAEALTGAAGAAIGGATAGGMGAVAGGVLGGVAALMADKPWNDSEEMAKNIADDNDYVRAYVADFFPLSSLTPTSTSEYEMSKYDPLSETPSPGAIGPRALLNASPVEPFAVMMPLLDIMNGVTAFGQEVPAKSRVDATSKMALSLLGFLAPPWMQKYGFKIDGPDGNPVDLYRAWQDNGRMLTMPNDIEATYHGVSGRTITALGMAAGAAGLTYLGGSKLRGAQAGAAVVAKAAGAVSELASPVSKAGLLTSAGITGAISGYAGLTLNTRRLLTDLGIVVDPNTERMGNHTMDFFMQNFWGTAKSFQGTPLTVERNNNDRSRRFDDMRTVYTKDLYDSLKNTGDMASARGIIIAVRNSFVAEEGSVDTGVNRYKEWVANVVAGMPNMAVLSSISREDLLQRMAAYGEAVDAGNRFTQQQLRQLQVEYESRLMNNAKHMKINMQDVPSPYTTPKSKSKKR